MFNLQENFEKELIRIKYDEKRKITLEDVKKILTNMMKIIEEKSIDLVLSIEFLSSLSFLIGEVRESMSFEWYMEHITPFIVDDYHPLENICGFAPLDFILDRWEKNIKLAEKHHSDCMFNISSPKFFIPDYKVLSSHPDLTLEVVEKFPSFDRMFNYDHCKWDAEILFDRFLSKMSEEKARFIVTSDFKTYKAILPKFSWFTKEFVLAGYLSKLIDIIYERAAYHSEYEPFIKLWAPLHEIPFLLDLIDPINKIVVDQASSYVKHVSDVEAWTEQLMAFNKKELSIHPDVTIEFVHANPKVNWDWKILHEKFEIPEKWVNREFLMNKVKFHPYGDFPPAIIKFTKTEFKNSKYKESIRKEYLEFLVHLMLEKDPLSPFRQKKVEGFARKHIEHLLSSGTDELTHIIIDNVNDKNTELNKLMRIRIQVYETLFEKFHLIQT